MKDIATIYTARDATGCVRYVGLTTSSVEFRAQQHSYAKSPVGHAIRQDHERGLIWTFVEEERFVRPRNSPFEMYRNESGEAVCILSREKAYIRGYRRLLGDRLLNRESGRKRKIKINISKAAS